MPRDESWDIVENLITPDNLEKFGITNYENLASCLGHLTKYNRTINLPHQQDITKVSHLELTSNTLSD